MTRQSHETMLVGIDSSAGSAAAVRWAAAEAARRGARLHAVHVVDLTGRADARLEKSPLLELDEARRTLPSRVAGAVFRAGIELDIAVTVACGSVAQRLAHEAVDASVVAIGAPQGPSHADLPRLLSEQCLCPVAVVGVDGGVEFPDALSHHTAGAGHARS